MLYNLFSFEGRIRRTDYCLSLLLYFIASFILEQSIITTQNEILGLLYIPLLWYLWAQGAKRCHDVGRNGWWQIIPFYILYLMFGEGQEGSNDYGRNPKGIVELVEVSSNSNPISPQSENISWKVSLPINGRSIFEVRNVNYSNLQEVLRQLRSLNFVQNLSYDILDSTANIVVNHQNNSQFLLEEFIKVNQGVSVLEVATGKIVIKIK